MGFSQKCIKKVLRKWATLGYPWLRHGGHVGKYETEDGKGWYDEMHFSLASFREKDDCLQRRKKDSDNSFWFTHNEVLVWPLGNYTQSLTEALAGIYVSPKFCRLLNGVILSGSTWQNPDARTLDFLAFLIEFILSVKEF